MWLKWRHKWKSGHGEWEWTDIGSCNSQQYIDEVVWGLQENYFDDTDYRGIEYEKAEKPPEKVIKSEIEKLQKEISWQKQRIVELQELLK